LAKTKFLPSHLHLASASLFFSAQAIVTMLDLLDFQADKGGDLNKLRENQRRRYAPEAVVEDVVALFEDYKKSIFSTFAFGPS
jgi:hypothetical protein